MKLTESIIKNFTSEEYRKYRSEIKDFYDNKIENKKLYDKGRYVKSIVKEITGKPYRKTVELSPEATIIRMHTKGKECKSCLDYKKWDDFHHDSNQKDGKRNICKSCVILNAKIKRNTDVNSRILHNLRNRLYHSLKGNRKSDTTMNLVGCSREKLKAHLESKFKDNMSWANYGKWHIDHIKPCASFDLSKPEDQKECFHYTNLQPLWAIENITKGSKY